MSTYTYTNREGATHTAPAMLEPNDLPESFRGAALARVEVDGVVLFDADRQAAMLATAMATVATAPSAPAVLAPPVTIAAAPSVAGPKGVSDFGRNDVFDTDAAARIAAQDAELRAHGIVADRTQQVAKSGTRMAASGYATQASRAREHAAKMHANDAIDAIVQTVTDERRRDLVVSAAEVARNMTVNGKISVFGRKLTLHAIRGLSARCEVPMGNYLAGLNERLGDAIRAARALESTEDGRKPTAEDLASAKALRERANADRAKMADVIHYELMRAGEARMTLRMRDAGPLDVFAVVGPGYGRADAPDVLPRVRDAVPHDARATWAYDPTSTTWELRASIWTPTPVSEQAIGEAFEGWVSFRGHDGGGGCLRGGGGTTLIRCYNASVYEAEARSVARQHRKNVLVDIASMTKGALAAIDALCIAWGRAREADVTVPEKVTLAQAIPGFWTALLKDSRHLAGVLPGRKADHAKGLTAAYFAERRDPERIVRADFAQAWTRYIQDQPAEVRRDAEAAIGGWIVNDRRPLRCDLPDVK
jgi:hypothetical protein